MTDRLHAHKEILKQTLLGFLNSMIAESHSLYNIREMKNHLALSSKYPEFTVWGPEIHNNNKLVIFIWEWVDGVKEETIVETCVSQEWILMERGDNSKTPTY